jgi:hypothetical protein
VGLGSDFDGIDAKCEGLEDTSTYPNLIAEILRMAPNTSDEEIAGLLGENLLRVWEKVEVVRDSLQSKNPSEKIWKGRKNWTYDRRLWAFDRKLVTYERERSRNEDDPEFDDPYWDS